MGIPANITAGDSATWTDDPYLDDSNNRYDSGTYTLKYELRGPGAPLTLTAAANGQGWKTTLSTTASAALTAGLWFWAATLNKTGERVTAARGEITVSADLTPINAPGYEGRTTAEIALADAEKALADLTGSGKKVKKYAIGSRQAEYYTAADLITAISYWRLRVANERKARAISDGLGDPSNLMVRFS